MPTGQRPSGRVLLTRWMLLVAVVAGIFGMHVLSGDHDATGMAGMTGAISLVADGSAASEGSADPAAPDHHAALHHSPAVAPGEADGAGVDRPGLPPATGHDGLASCVLFLVVGCGLALLITAARRLAATSTGVLDGGVCRRPVAVGRPHRGPPGPSLFVALGVLRV